jgi:hypothetical protein
VSLTSPNNLSAVSLTPVNRFLAMSLTLVKIFWFFGYFPVTRINDTGDKIFAGVIDTAEQFKNINSRISPRILEKIQNGPTGILGGLGDTDS